MIHIPPSGRVARERENFELFYRRTAGVEFRCASPYCASAPLPPCPPRKSTNITILKVGPLPPHHLSTPGTLPPEQNPTTIPTMRAHVQEHNAIKNVEDSNLRKRNPPPATTTPFKANPKLTNSDPSHRQSGREPRRATWSSPRLASLHRADTVFSLFWGSSRGLKIIFRHAMLVMSRPPPAAAACGCVACGRGRAGWTPRQPPGTALPPA